LGDKQINYLVEYFVHGRDCNFVIPGCGRPDCDKLSPRLESIWLRPNGQELESPEEKQLFDWEEHVKADNRKRKPMHALK
jgi:hypothetical protein